MPTVHRDARRGAVLVLVTLMMVVLVAAAALAVDYGYLLVVRNQLQAAADSAALAGAMTLFSNEAVTGQMETTELIDAAQQAAADFAGRNFAAGGMVAVSLAAANDPNSDVVVGHLDDPTDRDEALSFTSDQDPNTVQVTLRLTKARGNPVGLFLASVLGVGPSNVTATAAASAVTDIRGFGGGSSAGNTSLLPFAMSVDYWNSVVNGAGGGTDNYRYDAASGQVVAGSDGIPELNLYPLDFTPTQNGGGGEPTVTGNFGTVDIGSPSGSTADIARQIVYGISQSDLAYHGGSIGLDETGHLILSGDPGFSGGMKDEMESIIGQTRTIPLFESAEGHGNNCEYDIVGFAGIRILDVFLTGALRNRYVVVQPAVVVDPTAIPGSGPGMSQFICMPVMLVR